MTLHHYRAILAAVWWRWFLR